MITVLSCLELLGIGMKIDSNLIINKDYKNKAYTIAFSFTWLELFIPYNLLPQII